MYAIRSYYGLDAEHPDVLQTLHMRQVAFAERHEEADTLEPLDMLHERLHLFMVSYNFV